MTTQSDPNVQSIYCIIFGDTGLGKWIQMSILPGSVVCKSQKLTLSD